MTTPPDDPSPELERVVDAISDGATVAWEDAAAGPAADPETLAALRLIDDIARLHRGRAAPPGDASRSDTDEPRWGNLRLRGRLGAGAFGEVHRAFDPGLEREVALKLWTGDVRPSVLQRLLGEARALARVRHPNVLLVHGADVHEGRVGMWTELLDGATLEELLAGTGPAHWREAALIGIELCRALAAVHAIGFVHLDVKATNVMRERGGRIVLMDFGCAGDAGEAVLPNQGTPLAMAPEVLAGESPTPAADLYSLGVLLFRLVAGRYPVEAESLPALRARLAESALPSLREYCPDVPLAFARVVERALARAPAERPGSAAEMERSLAEALSSDWGRTSAPRRATSPRRPAWRRPRTWLVAAGALAIVLAGTWWVQRGPGSEPARPMQFTLQLPLGEYLPQYANVVVSPDGRSIAFASIDSLGHRALWLRRFDALGSTRIPGTDGAAYPFWSPDSRELGFFSRGWLKRVGVDGDSVRVICEAELGRGGSWSRLGTILFASSTQGPLFRVRAGGGTPVPATTLDTLNGEVSHRWPSFLPDGKHFLYVRTPTTESACALFVGSLDSDRRVHVGEVESGAFYTSGMLVYTQHQSLEARPFNLRTLRWDGDPVPISNVPGVGGSLAEPHCSVSRNGTLVYSSLAVRESRLQWTDLRSGVSRDLAIGPFFGPRISPDGRRVAVERVEGSGHSNIWMLDAETGAAERWTDGVALNRSPVWSSGGDSIVYSSNRSGRYELFERAVTGSPAERRVFSPANALLLWPDDWRPGGLLVVDVFEPGTSANVYELQAGRPVPVAHGNAAERNGALSPDGRWLAYDSDVSVRTQIQVVDRQTRERFVLRGEPGFQPRWSRSAGKLFYRTPTGTFIEVSPLPGRLPTEWSSREVVRVGIVEGYDVDARGERLLCCLKTAPGRPEEIGVLANLVQAVKHGF